jgi:hypothetical protein
VAGCRATTTTTIGAGAGVAVPLARRPEGAGREVADSAERVVAARAD